MLGFLLVCSGRIKCLIEGMLERSRYLYSNQIVIKLLLGKCMSQEIVEVRGKFACTLGLAAFVGVPGTKGDHSHWLNQIAIDMEGGAVSCFCEGSMVEGEGVFVPYRHSHRVGEGRQINLFFDRSITWIDEVFGGRLDTACASVLDRDTLMGIQSCFHGSMGLTNALRIFAEAVQGRNHQFNTAEQKQSWRRIIDEVILIKSETHLTDQEVFTKIGQLFA